MGCGCNKNKNTEIPKKESVISPVPPTYIPKIRVKNKIMNDPTQNTNIPPANPPASQSFRKDVVVPPAGNFLKRNASMMKSFATALASRGLANEKVSKATKQLRVLSCFGDGKILPPCEQLKGSSTPGKHFCGGCGCGDKKGTWLVSAGDEYSKLDYPKLACPLNMPGFSNYKESSADEATPPITRRYYIENISYNELERIQVTLHNAPIPPPKTPEPKV